MRSSCVIIMSLATLIVCCYGNYQQEQDISGGERRENYDMTGYKVKRSDNHQPEKQLRRQIRQVRIIPYIFGRRNINGSVWNNNMDKREPHDSNDFEVNFDEIDQTSMPFPSKRRFFYSRRDDSEPSPVYDSYLKRNFDEIDQTSMPFPSKRRVVVYRVGGDADSASYGLRRISDDNDQIPIPMGALRLGYARYLPPFK